MWSICTSGNEKFPSNDTNARTLFPQCPFFAGSFSVRLVIAHQVSAVNLGQEVSAIRRIRHRLVSYCKQYWFTAILSSLGLQLLSALPVNCCISSQGLLIFWTNVFCQSPTDLRLEFTVYRRPTPPAYGPPLSVRSHPWLQGYFPSATSLRLTFHSRSPSWSSQAGPETLESAQSEKYFPLIPSTSSLTAQ